MISRRRRVTMNNTAAAATWASLPTLTLKYSVLYYKYFLILFEFLKCSIIESKYCLNILKCSVKESKYFFNIVWIFEFEYLKWSVKESKYFSNIVWIFWNVQLEHPNIFSILFEYLKCSVKESKYFFNIWNVQL